MGRLTTAEVTSVARALDEFERSVKVLLHNEMGDAHQGKFNELAGEVHDEADEAVADEMMSIDGAMAERHGRELLEIERARRRLRGDDFGECIDCAGEIGVARLLANPVAERCIACEARHERNYAHAATPRL